MKKIVGKIFFEIQEEIANQGEKVDKEKIVEIISKWIDKYYNEWKNEENLYSEKIINRIKKELSADYGEILNSHIDSTFGSSEISEASKEKISSIHLYVVLQD